MRPLHRRKQSALPGRRRPARSGQEREPVVQPGEDLGHGGGPEPGCGQLERQRQAVQLPAHRHDVGCLRRHVGAGLPGPLQEQPGRVVPAQVGLARPGGRYRQRMHPPHDLALHLKHSPAGRQYPQRPGPAQQMIHQLRNTSAEVLAVIQHQQRPGLSQHLGHDVQPGAGRDGRDRARHRPGDRLRPGQRRQVDPPDPAGKTRRERGRQPQRQPGLAGPPGPGQREQPPLPQQIRTPRQIPGPPHERADLGREVAANPQPTIRAPWPGSTLPHPRSVTDHGRSWRARRDRQQPRNQPPGRCAPGWDTAAFSSTWPMFPGSGPGTVPGN